MTKELIKLANRFQLKLKKMAGEYDEEYDNNADSTNLVEGSNCYGCGGSPTTSAFLRDKKKTVPVCESCAEDTARLGDSRGSDYYTSAGPCPNCKCWITLGGDGNDGE